MRAHFVLGLSLFFLNSSLCHANQLGFGTRSEIDCYKNVLRYTNPETADASSTSIVFQAPNSATTWWMTLDGLHSTRTALPNLIKKGGTFSVPFKFDPVYLQKNPDMRGKMSKLILDPGTGFAHSDPAHPLTTSSDVVFKEANPADKDQFLKDFSQAIKQRFDSIRDPNERLWAAQACKDVPNLGKYIPLVDQAAKDAEAEQNRPSEDDGLGLSQGTR